MKRCNFSAWLYEVAKANEQQAMGFLSIRKTIEIRVLLPFFLVGGERKAHF